MKKYLFLLLIVFCNVNIALCDDPHTAYEVQRLKINKLLDDRSQKFGQYDTSLTERTGIFGLKTKKDMQRSINILANILETDNHILKELKILFDYKDLEKTTVEVRAQTSETRVDNYMQTITKLQKQTDKLKTEINSLEAENGKLQYYKYGAFALLALVAFLVYKLKS